MTIPQTTPDQTNTTTDPAAETAAWRVLLARWHAVYRDRALTARQLWHSVDLDLALDPWQGTLPVPTGPDPVITLGVSPVHSLGKRLTSQIDQWHGGFVVRSAIDPHLKYRVYWVGHRPDPDQPAAPSGPDRAGVGGRPHRLVGPGAAPTRQPRSRLDPPG